MMLQGAGLHGSLIRQLLLLQILQQPEGRLEIHLLIIAEA
jgi:hypothetical protein